MELRVRPGDNATLYCDEENKKDTLWYRNCSHEHQPRLVISVLDISKKMNLNRNPFPRFSPSWNPSNEAWDLVIENVSESDLGLYYCGTMEIQVYEATGGPIVDKEVYSYGHVITKLSFGKNKPLFAVFGPGCMFVRFDHQ